MAHGHSRNYTTLTDATLDVDGIKVLMKVDLYDPGLVKVALNGSFC